MLFFLQLAFIFLLSVGAALVWERLMQLRRRQTRQGGPWGRAAEGAGESLRMTPTVAKRAALIGGGALALVLGLSSFYIVPPDSKGVVIRFGEAVRVSLPGPHLKIPLLENVHKVPVERVLKEEFGFRTIGRDGDQSQYSTDDFSAESLMLTGDLNLLEVEWSVQYKIADPVKFMFSMRDPIGTLRDLSESIMRRMIGNRLGSRALTVDRPAIAAQTKIELQDAMKQYDNGIHIVGIQLQDIVPPERVKTAFNAVNQARQKREELINEAQLAANQRLPLERGQAASRVQKAEGYATQRVNQAHGDVARFSAIRDEYIRAPEVTRARLYLEAMQDVLPDFEQIVVKDGEGPVPFLNMRERQPKPSQDFTLGAAAGSTAAQKPTPAQPATPRGTR
jgi:modulator of FtsH protease HflK